LGSGGGGYELKGVENVEGEIDYPLRWTYRRRILGV